ncbi:MAG: helix-turn-helix transcriptional regulator [Aeriscardovia sp.]|nr:helix-turn-helix transcriptional regulator [Aeriscardovia sp.]
MAEVKLNIRSLAAMKKISIETLAKESGISPDHLLNVSAGRSTFTAMDLAKLVAYTGVPVEHINVDEP